ncbi:MAG: nucleoside phosphorylase [Thermodesulfobacteriota bacterium]|nr:nucleoside phosphorylase [Thermodesulfobacteriota bacterium]
MKRPRDEVLWARREEGDPAMGPMAIMVAMEQDLAAIRRSLGIDGRRPWRMLSSRLYRGVCDDQDVALVGPMCGAPYAVMVLEKLVALGAKRLVFWGWCGSLQQSLPVGGVLIPDRAISEEGTSAHYPVASSHLRPSGRLLEAIEESLWEYAVPFQRGAVWTTDAPYRETREKIVAFQGQGVLGVEMEVSALFAVAAFRQIDMGALLLVSDDLSSLRWKPGISSTAFKEARNKAIGVIPSLCGKIADSTLWDGE